MAFLSCARKKERIPGKKVFVGEDNNPGQSGPAGQRDNAAGRPRGFWSKPPAETITHSGEPPDGPGSAASISDSVQRTAGRTKRREVQQDAVPVLRQRNCCSTEGLVSGFCHEVTSSSRTVSCRRWLTGLEWDRQEALAG